MADLPFLLQPRQRAELVLERHLGVDTVELQQIDPLQPEPAEAALDLSPEVFGPAVLDPLIGARPPEARPWWR